MPDPTQPEAKIHPARAAMEEFWKRVWSNGVRALSDGERAERDRLLAAIPDDEIVCPFREIAALVGNWDARQRGSWSHDQLAAHSHMLEK